MDDVIFTLLDQNVAQNIFLKIERCYFSIVTDKSFIKLHTDQQQNSQKRYGDISIAK